MNRHILIRHLHAGAVVGLSIVWALTPVAFASEGDPTLVVRVFDSSRALDGDGRALAVAAAIIEQAGVVVRWKVCGPGRGAEGGGCGLSPGHAELMVRIVRAPKTAERGALGYSLIDAQQGLHQRRGQLATVFVDRVQTMATRAAADPVRLLGRATAHEIMHLILGHAGHSSTGLMRARWEVADVRQERPSDWAVDEPQATEVRCAVLARLATGELPTLLAREDEGGRPALLASLGPGPELGDGLGQAGQLQSCQAPKNS